MINNKELTKDGYIPVERSNEEQEKIRQRVSQRRFIEDQVKHKTYPNFLMPVYPDDDDYMVNFKNTENEKLIRKTLLEGKNVSNLRTFLPGMNYLDEPGELFQTDENIVDQGRKMLEKIPNFMEQQRVLREKERDMALPENLRPQMSYIPHPDAERFNLYDKTNRLVQDHLNFKNMEKGERIKKVNKVHLDYVKYLEGIEKIKDDLIDEFIVDLKEHEGDVPMIYLDSKCLETAGPGFRVFTKDDFHKYPIYKKDENFNLTNELASTEEKDAIWDFLQTEDKAACLKILEENRQKLEKDRNSKIKSVASYKNQKTYQKYIKGFGIDKSYTDDLLRTKLEKMLIDVALDYRDHGINFLNLERPLQKEALDCRYNTGQSLKKWPKKTEATYYNNSDKLLKESHRQDIPEKRQKWIGKQIDDGAQQQINEKRAFCAPGYYNKKW